MLTAMECLWTKKITDLRRLTRQLMAQLLGIAQRTVEAVFDCPSQRFSPRKLIPVNVKTLGDHLHLQRIKANLSQQEVAQKLGVSNRMVRNGNMVMNIAIR